MILHKMVSMKRAFLIEEGEDVATGILRGSGRNDVTGTNVAGCLSLFLNLGVGSQSMLQNSCGSLLNSRRLLAQTKAIHQCQKITPSRHSGHSGPGFCIL